MLCFYYQLINFLLYKGYIYEENIIPYFNLKYFAMETTSTTSSTCNIYNDVESSGARIVHNYKKTITKVYKSRSSIPDSINYSEYNNSLKGTFSGRLYLKSIKKTASGWQATFSGTLTGRI